MIIEAFAIMMAMATPKNDPVTIARKAFSNCLVDVTVASLEKKDAESAFMDIAKAACADEKAKFHSAIVASERSIGSKMADAEEFANDEVQGLIERYTGSYADFAKDGSQPTKQK
jgi:hypothetical protein